MALGIAALCGAYNAAAWLTRREKHLAINAVCYAALMVFEQRHVAHHVAELRRPAAPPDALPGTPVAEVPPVPVPAAAAPIAA